MWSASPSRAMPLMQAVSAPVLLSATVLLGASARADTIDLRADNADNWCPLNCVPDSDRPGYMEELAQEALALFGHKLRYSSINWSRSLSQARRGDITGVIGTDKQETPDLILGGAMGHYQAAYVFRSGEVQAITTAEDLEGIRIGAIADYEYNARIAAYVAKNKETPERVQLIGGDDALRRNLRKQLKASGRYNKIPKRYGLSG